jgi:tRNA(Arg) A34 adenosine deaminase TadA
MPRMTASSGPAYPSLSDVERSRVLQAVLLAERALAKGNRPFGAVIVGADGQVLAEAENTTITDHDFAAHAEVNAMREVCRLHGQDRLAGATAYTNCPPCPMCAGAMMRFGLRRIVYGTSWHVMKDRIPASSAVYGADLEKMLSAAEQPIELVGPCLDEDVATRF